MHTVPDLPRPLSVSVTVFFCLCLVWPLFYYWAIRSHDLQFEINTYLLTYFTAVACNVIVLLYTFTVGSMWYMGQGHNYATKFPFRVRIWRHNHVKVTTYVWLGLCRGQNLVKRTSHNHEDATDLAGWQATCISTAILHQMDKMAFLLSVAHLELL